MMGWTDLIGLALVLVILVGVLRVMFRSQKPSPDKVERPWLRSFLSGTFLAGLLSAVAVGALVHDSSRGQSDGWAIGLVVGAVIALIFGPLSVAKKWDTDGVLTGLLSAVFGAIGLIVTVSSYFTPQGVCTPADIGQRVLGFALVVVALVLGSTLAWTRSLFHLKNLGPSLLALFGVLQILDLLVFLSNPLGVTLTGLGISGWLMTLVAAFAMGFATPIWPKFVLAVTGISVGAGAVYATSSGAATSLCVPGVADPSALGPLIGYVAVFAVVRLVLGRVLNPQRKQAPLTRDRSH